MIYNYFIPKEKIISLSDMYNRLINDIKTNHEFYAFSCDKKIIFLLKDNSLFIDYDMKIYNISNYYSDKINGYNFWISDLKYNSKNKLNDYTYNENRITIKDSSIIIKKLLRKQKIENICSKLEIK